MVVQCCVCKRIRVEDNWVGVANPESIARTASHGYCPTCFVEALAERRTLIGAVQTMPPAA